MTWRMIGLPYFCDFVQQNNYDEMTTEFQRLWNRLILIYNERDVRNQLWSLQYDIDRANFFRFIPFEFLVTHADFLNHLLEDDWWEYSALFRDLYNRITSKRPIHQQWLNNSLSEWLGGIL